MFAWSNVGNYAPLWALCLLVRLYFLLLLYFLFSPNCFCHSFTQNVFFLQILILPKINTDNDICGHFGIKKVDSELRPFASPVPAPRLGLHPRGRVPGTLPWDRRQSGHPGLARAPLATNRRLKMSFLEGGASIRVEYFMRGKTSEKLRNTNWIYNKINTSQFRGLT